MPSPAAHAQRELRARLGIDLAAVVLLNLGAVCERKGQHTFLRAAALLEPELRQRHPDRPVEFVMVGAREDDYLALLRLQVADAGLQRVRFVPETRENFAWLRLADILVCTSFEESSPRVLLEAASFGLPIVTTNVNGIPELVTEDEAWLVGPGDPHQLAEAIRQALAAHLVNDSGRGRTCPPHGRRAFRRTDFAPPASRPRPRGGGLPHLSHARTRQLAVCRRSPSPRLAFSRRPVLARRVDLRGRAPLHHRPAGVD
jgi:glycosyltransferase involved in cell wall biosynthesis